MSTTTQFNSSYNLQNPISQFTVFLTMLMLLSPMTPYYTSPNLNVNGKENKNRVTITKICKLRFYKEMTL